MLKAVSRILALADWEIFLNPSGMVSALSSGRLLDVFPRKGTAYKVISLSPSERQYSAAVEKLKFPAPSPALPAMALAASRGQIPRPVLIVAAQGKSGEFSKAFLGATLAPPLALAVEVVGL
jgi:hypothetical protein